MAYLDPFTWPLNWPLNWVSVLVAASLAKNEIKYLQYFGLNYLNDYHKTTT